MSEPSIPGMPQWLVAAAGRLPREQRGVAIGFAAAGWVAALTVERAEPTSQDSEEVPTDGQ